MAVTVAVEVCCEEAVVIAFVTVVHTSVTVSVCTVALVVGLV